MKDYQFPTLFKLVTLGFLFSYKHWTSKLEVRGETFNFISQRVSNALVTYSAAIATLVLLRLIEEHRGT